MFLTALIHFKMVQDARAGNPQSNYHPRPEGGGVRQLQNSAKKMNAVSHLIELWHQREGPQSTAALQEIPPGANRHL